MRLGGLDAPTAERGSPETANSAREFLSARLLGRPADLIQLAGGADRWGSRRRPRPCQFGGRVRRLDRCGAVDGGLCARPAGVQTRGCAAERLAIEAEARQEQKGIWRDPQFAVIQSANSAELRRWARRFVVVEGMVRRVGFARSRIYLELVPRDGPTIVVARKLETALAREGRPVAAMVGQTIRARGALDDRFGPKIEVADPAMIEIARRADASGEAKPHP